MTAYPKDADLRTALLGRAEQFSRATGIAQSVIAKRCVNDSGFFCRLAQGRNFTIQTYQRVMDWLDQNEVASLRSTNPIVNPDFAGVDKAARVSS